MDIIDTNIVFASSLCNLRSLQPTEIADSVGLMTDAVQLPGFCTDLTNHKRRIEILVQWKIRIVYWLLLTI